MSLDFPRLHVIGEHGNGESPVNECERGEETCHHHILNPTCLNEEEPDNHKQNTVDEVQPPIFSASLADGTDYGADAPEQEDYRDEIREDGLRQYDTAHQHEADEHIYHTAGNPPPPSARIVTACGHTQLNDARKHKQPAENLRRNSISGHRPEPICKSAQHHKDA